jgi:Ca-activated chloride channel homolog
MMPATVPIRAALVLLMVIVGLPMLARAQEGVNIVVPQGRHVVVPPEPHVGVPRPDPRTRPHHIQLTAVESHISIRDQVATTTLVLTLSNSTARPQEAQVLLPVPDGAVIRSFQLDSLGSEPTAKLLPREEARRIYNDIVRRMQDPGLLEFAGYNQIRSSVFPIPANGQETVRLSYEHMLEADVGTDVGVGGRIDYTLPRSDVGQGELRWKLNVDIRAQRPIATVYSPSHDITTERHGPSHITVRATLDSGSQPGSFRLSYLLEEKKSDGLTATMMAYPDPAVGDGQGGYFLLLAGLPQSQASDKPILREVTIVIDRSGSMRGEKMDQAREAARQVIEGLHPGEAFNIIDFADTVQKFSAAPVVKNDESIARARAYLKTIQANGGTNIHDALVEALRQPPTEGMLPVVLFLTDGQATVGRTRETDIREAALKRNPHERRIFTFGVGHDVNAPLLSALAREARAISTFVAPQENVEVKVGQVFRRLSGPVLAAPKLTVLDQSGQETTGLVRELQPAQIPDIFEGDQLMVLGQYTQQRPIRFRLEGNFRGVQRQFDFTLDTATASTEHAYVPRLWASRRIAMLMEEVRAAGADGRRPSANDPRVKELVDEIVRLSMQYGLLTEYTAFLALEPGQPPGAPPPPAREADMRARQHLFESSAQRSGDEGVRMQQDMDLQRHTANVEQMNRWAASVDGRQRRAAGVQHIGDRALFNRGQRWVDARLLHQEHEEPQSIVEFGTPEYDRLLERLARENLQALLANRGETYLLIDGQRTLVRAP